MVNSVFRKTNADIAHVLDFCRCQQCEDDQTFLHQSSGGFGSKRHQRLGLALMYYYLKLDLLDPRRHRSLVFFFQTDPPLTLPSRSSSALLLSSNCQHNERRSFAIVRVTFGTD